MLESEVIFEEAAQLVDEQDDDPKTARRRRLANIAVLMEQNPHLVAALREEMDLRKERYVRRLANQLALDGRPADQRALDFQRGLWYGATLALVALPREAAKARTLMNETEEANS